jgi:ParB family chromosome partitioning protein
MGLADRIKKTTDGLQAKVEKRMEAESAAQRKPVTMPGQLSAFMLDAERYNEKIAELEEKLSTVPFIKIQLTDLHEVAGRKRKLSDEQFSELVENLRHNDLITPITVRPRPEGGYEIVSGHNRAAAFRELGRTEIDAVVRALDHEKATMGAFFANLLQPQLPDFEKFLGLMAVKAVRPELTLDEMARQTGLSRSHIHRILSFADLPEEALKLIEANPAALGANAAAEIAQLAKVAGAEIVVDAIRQLIEQKISQDEAIRFVGNANKPSAPKAEAVKKEPVVFKQGKRKFLTVRPTASPTSFRLEFADPDEASLMMQKFQEWVEKQLEK